MNEVSFPTVTDRELIGDAVHPGDEWFIDKFPTYGWYYEIARAYVAPLKQRNSVCRILEMGVRYGYAAIALGKGIESAHGYPEYVGIDGEMDGVESNAVAQRNIEKAVDVRGRIIKRDTKDATAVNAAISQYIDNRLFHIIHIDGDHSPEGIKAEIELAKLWSINHGIILIDDCDTEHVRSAALDLAFELNTRIRFFPTIHRLAVIDVP